MNIKISKKNKKRIIFSIATTILSILILLLSYKKIRSFFPPPEIGEGKLIGFSQYFGYSFYFDSIFFFILIFLPIIVFVVVKKIK